MNTNGVTNRQVICDTLKAAAKTDKNIVVLCSDSRGSGSMTSFADSFPEQFVEVGIAEQNLVSVAAGLASCGKKAFAVSPASFLSTRSYEQAKVDVAYSDTNVTLVGISGGISYGALGMTHHSCQDIAAMAALPNMRVYLPSDRFQTAALIKALLQDDKPSYVRVSRSASEDIYDENEVWAFNKAKVLAEGSDVAIVACGETVKPSLGAVDVLRSEGISAGLLDICCVKPIDRESVVKAASGAKVVVTVEEHSPYGGLGSIVAQIVSAECPRKVAVMSLPDGHIVPGSSAEVFEYYGLTPKGIANFVKKVLQ